MSRFQSKVIGYSKKAVPLPDLLTIYIVPKNENGFPGYDLLQTLTSSGLNFGEHQMFHHLDADGHILFSVCSTEEPGHFDISNMGQFKAQGLAVFIDPKQNNFSEGLFNKFYEISRLICEDLMDKCWMKRKLLSPMKILMAGEPFL